MGHLLNASLATNGGQGELGGPTPTLFSADMRNWYWLPSTRSVTANFSSATAPLLIFNHLSVVAKQRSTWYPVTGEPPSSFGGCQATTHPVLVTSDIVGASGGPGLSAFDNMTIHAVRTYPTTSIMMAFIYLVLYVRPKSEKVYKRCFHKQL